jgi:hypothetical protein
VGFFGRVPKLALYPHMRLQILAKAQILFALLLAQPSNLNQIGNHYLQGTV